MNIDTLKLFCLVVELGSISQAAKLSYVSQPAVTKQIRQLEEIYGTTLFNRTAGRLTPNENGETLYPIAKSIVSDYNRSIEAVSDNIRQLDSIIKVGASYTLGEYFLPHFLGTFKKRYPESKITLIVDNTPNVLKALSNDVIDIALVEGTVNDKHLNVEPFADDELILIHPLEHSWTNRDEIKIDELTKEKMIWREPTSGTRLIIENFLNEKGVLDKIETYMELGTTQAIKSAVEAGLGISIVSKYTVEKELELELFRKINIKSTQFKRELWLVRKKTRFHKKSVENFVALLKKYRNTEIK